MLLMPEDFDVITSRAFSRLEMFVALAAPLLKSGGRMIAMKGPHVDNEFEHAGDELRRLGFEISSIEYIFPANEQRRAEPGNGYRCKSP